MQEIAQNVFGKKQAKSTITDLRKVHQLQNSFLWSQFIVDDACNSRQDWHFHIVLLSQRNNSSSSRNPFSDLCLDIVITP